MTLKINVTCKKNESMPNDSLNHKYSLNHKSCCEPVSKTGVNCCLNCRQAELKGNESE